VKVKELIEQFDELGAKYLDALKARDELASQVKELTLQCEHEQKAHEAQKARSQDLENHLQQTESRAARMEAASAEQEKGHKELLGRIRVLEKHKVGLRDKVLSLEKERKAAAEKANAPPGKTVRPRRAKKKT
jgi:chromosome segregation ATPase